jgi:hypothetical protein
MLVGVSNLTHVQGLAASEGQDKCWFQSHKDHQHSSVGPSFPCQNECSQRPLATMTMLAETKRLLVYKVEIRDAKTNSGTEKHVRYPSRWRS